MSKKDKAPPLENATLPPRYEWDQGEYSRDQTIRFFLPWQFLSLCKLTEVEPKEILDRFMNDLGQESWKRRENDAVRHALIEYFILCGYGQKWYTEQDLRQMFRELDAIGSLWPHNAKMKLIDLHARWRNKYHNYWFRKWFFNPRRQL